MNKTVSKSEMGLRYFPNIQKYSARRKLVDYLKTCKEWQPGNRFENRRYFTPDEIRQIEKIMG